MGFSKKVKEDILVASARHCCVCHRYKGIKIEIHHILPKEQGGKDTFENAISLCYDCHSDAGHYFSKHPKGTKFSPSELKKHKESWFEIVKNNNISQKTKSLIHSRFIITKDFSLIKEIINRDLSNFPIKDTLLIENESLDFIKQITKNKTYRNEEIQNLLNIDLKDYLKKFPSAKTNVVDKEEHIFFHHKRIPKIEEIIKNCVTDNLTNYLVKAGVKAEKIAKIHTCYEGECGGEGRFQELYLLRPIYFKCLVITNVSSDYIKIKELVSKSFEGILYNKNAFKHSEKIIFPEVLISPKESVLIPIGSFLSDFEVFDATEHFSNCENISTGEFQTFNYGNIHLKKEVEFIGKNYLPEEIKIEVSGQKFHQKIHEFNFNYIYWIDRYWGYGSCPHLFFKYENGEIKYQGEILNVSPNIIQTEKFQVINNISAVIIAELEQETTEIEYIKLNGITISSLIKLTEGQSFEFPVEKFDKIEIKGKYYTNSTIFEQMPKLKKESLIRKYKKNY
jgi:HNH endonuclease